jgi:hypothetical protein
MYQARIFNPRENMMKYYQEEEDNSIICIGSIEVEKSLLDQGVKVLTASNPGVKAYLAAQAEAAKPKSITARQAHEALIRKGLRDNIVNAIAGIPDPVEQALADNWFQRSNTFERNNETLVSIAGAIGLSSNDVDNLFAYAATL